MKYEQPNMEILEFSEKDITTTLGVSDTSRGEVIETDNLGWF